jgi:glycine cleavage system H lipoate-binding protein
VTTSTDPVTTAVALAAGLRSAGVRVGTDQVITCGRALREVAAGDAVAVVESVKTASDIYAPLKGTVVAVNDALQNAPERIND